ncbi:hypothetical protein Moror_2911 [Moniliophthora roreri MCA 2997]|uniref:Uncharacterized protein n=1 Tax=Moniliophthora roreri (strain MCA 2997) TaxID=1381753 RepID=V2XEF9_MONRO|nr:hypothetical protein Moror_2911 [Moniliophthora roreri MCA 2997]
MPADDKPRSAYQIIKDGWGNRVNFQLSYGLRMTPEDLQEGDLILDVLEKHEREDWEERRREAQAQARRR